MASKMIARTAAAERAALSSCLQQSRLAGRCSEDTVAHLQISHCLDVQYAIQSAHWEPCGAQVVLLTLTDLEPSDLVQTATAMSWPPWLIAQSLVHLSCSSSTQMVHRTTWR